jgi:uncharacterized protein
MQLSQPIQGVHPGYSGNPHWNIFSENMRRFLRIAAYFFPTWRMHEKICRFISDAVYDGRLEPDVKNQNQRLVLNEDADPGLVSAGILFRDVSHFGCSQRAGKADEVRKLMAAF